MPRRRHHYYLIVLLNVFYRRLHNELILAERSQIHQPFQLPLVLRELAPRHEGGDARDRPGIGQERRVAFVRHLDDLETLAARAHGINRGRRQDVGMAAADHHRADAGKRVELGPHRRQRLRRIEALESDGEFRVVIGDDAPVDLFENAVRERHPVFVAQPRKVAAEQTPKNVRGIVEVRRLRQLADVALDAHEALDLDHRADVVEHAARDRRRARGGKQHGHETAARGADEHRARDAERGEHGEDVAEFDHDVVIGGIAVVFRFAAAARIEHEDRPRCLGIAGERGRERLEVRSVARQPRQAHHRQRRARPPPPAAHV